MHLFNALQRPWAVAKPPVAIALPPPAATDEAPEAMPEACGWFDSSFELAKGLEISEQDDDLLYQLCAVFLH